MSHAHHMQTSASATEEHRGGLAVQRDPFTAMGLASAHQLAEGAKEEAEAWSWGGSCGAGSVGCQPQLEAGPALSGGLGEL